VADPGPGLRADAARRLDVVPAPTPSDGVWSERAAVASALARNPRIQAALARSGMARAELMDALTPSNPRLGLAARFPHAGGGVNLEIDVLQEILSLLFRPARARIASANYDAERLEIAQEIVEEALAVSEAWYDLVAAGQLRAMRRMIEEAAVASHEVAQRMAEAGNLSRLALAREAAAHAQAQADTLAAEGEVVEARERLRFVIGLAASDEALVVPDRLPGVPVSEPDTARLTAFALRCRPDLGALAWRVRALRRELGLATRLGPYEEIEVGVAFERESEGHWFTGPALEVEVPLFDQGQPRRALLASRLQETCWLARGLDGEIRTDIRAHRGRLDVLRREVELHATRLIPAREQVVALSQQEYNFMLLGVDKLLEAKREEFDAYAGYVEAIRAYWVERVRLERAVGARILVPEGGPTAMPTDRAPAAEDHGEHRGHPGHVDARSPGPPPEPKAPGGGGHEGHDSHGGGR